MTLSPFQLLGIVAAVLLLIWVEHRIRRRIQRRCSQCGSLRVKHTHNMLPDTDARHVCLIGRYFEVHIFSECRHCGHIAYRSYDRYFSRPALWWRKICKPWQFKRDERLFEQVGLGSSRKSVLSPPQRHIRIPRPPPPDRHEQSGGMHLHPDGPRTVPIALAMFRKK